MTWNLEQFPLTTRTATIVRDLILDLAVDLIGVQEIAEPDAFAALIAALPGYDGFDAWDDNPYLRVGMIFSTDRVKVEDVQTIFRSDGYAFPRSPLTAKVTTTATTSAFDFVFVVLHLKASNDAESRARRRAASRALDGWITDRMQDTGERDFVVVGDLNDRLTDDRQDNVFLAFLDAPDRYRFLTLPHAERGEHTFLPFDNMIDHILITADAEDELIEGHTEILHLEDRISGYRDHVSDHIPVRARFRFGD